MADLVQELYDIASLLPLDDHIGRVLRAAAYEIDANKFQIAALVGKLAEMSGHPVKS